MNAANGITPTKKSIFDGLDNLRDEADLPRFKSNDEPLIADAYVWDQVIEEATRRLDEAWKKIAEAKIVPDKKALREFGPGEHSAWSGNFFAVTAKVKEPGKVFDKEAFLATASKKFKVPLGKLVEVYDASKKNSTAACEISIVELN